MNNVRILLAYHDPLQAGQMHDRLSFGGRLTMLPIANDLTEAFNSAEHQTPDAILIHHKLTDLPEFELMRALLRALKVLCILFSPRGPRETVLSPFAAELPVIHQDLSVEMLHKKIGKSLQRRRLGGVPASQNQNQTDGYDKNRIILLGASTGGVDAVKNVIRAFGSDSPPVVLVQHTGGKFSESLTRLLDRSCACRVVAAADGQILQHGHIYVGGGDAQHTTISCSGQPKIRLVSAPKMSGHRPSIDALFKSAEPIANRVSAAILTGMGQDGADGLLRLRAAGARTFGQDKTTSVIYGMPRVAFELGAVEEQLPLNEIGRALLRTAAIVRR